LSVAGFGLPPVKRSQNDIWSNLPTKMWQG
jgi:hypothetical protein